MSRDRTDSLRMVDASPEVEVLRKESERALLPCLSFLTPPFGRVLGLQLCRWLSTSSSSVSSTEEAAAEDVRMNLAEQSEQSAFNTVFQRHSSAVWIQIVKGIVYSMEVLPKSAQRAFLEAYETFASSGEVSSGVERYKELFGPILEALPVDRWTLLAAICALLQRDRKHRNLVTSTYGPWLLLPWDSPRYKQSYRAVQMSAAIVSILVASPATFFGQNEARRNSLGVLELSLFQDDAADEFLNTPVKPQRSPSFLNRNGNLFFQMMKSRTSSEKNLLSPPADGFKTSLEEAPARSRDSLEKIYGRAPAPPPPKRSNEEIGAIEVEDDGDDLL